MMQSLQQGLSTFFAYIPQLLGAIIILIVGYIVAKILQAVTTRVPGAIGFEHWIRDVRGTRAASWLRER